MEMEDRQEIVDAIRQAAQMNIVAIMMAHRWTYEEAMKLAMDLEKDTRD